MGKICLGLMTTSCSTTVRHYENVLQPVGRVQVILLNDLVVYKESKIGSTVHFPTLASKCSFMYLKMVKTGYNNILWFYNTVKGMTPVTFGTSQPERVVHGWLFYTVRKGNEWAHWNWITLKGMSVLQNLSFMWEFYTACDIFLTRKRRNNKPKR